MNLTFWGVNLGKFAVDDIGMAVRTGLTGGVHRES